MRALTVHKHCCSSLNSKALRRQLRWLCALLFDGAKSRQKLPPPLHRPATRGALQCSIRTGCAELASLKHAAPLIRSTLRASAVHRLMNVKIKSKAKTHRVQARSCKNWISAVTRTLGGGPAGAAFFVQIGKKAQFMSHERQPKAPTVSENRNEGTERIPLRSSEGI